MVASQTTTTTLQEMLSYLRELTETMGAVRGPKNLRKND